MWADRPSFSWGDLKSSFECNVFESVWMLLQNDSCHVTDLSAFYWLCTCNFLLTLSLAIKQFSTNSTLSNLECQRANAFYLRVRASSSINDLSADRGQRVQNSNHRYLGHHQAPNQVSDCWSKSLHASSQILKKQPAFGVMTLPKGKFSVVQEIAREQMSVFLGCQNLVLCQNYRQQKMSSGVVAPIYSIRNISSLACKWRQQHHLEPCWENSDSIQTSDLRWFTLCHRHHLCRRRCHPTKIVLLPPSLNQRQPPAKCSKNLPLPLI